MKKCKICNKDFPMTLEYFYKNKTSSDGLNPYCKKCTSKKTMENRNKNREENLEKMRIYSREYGKRPERKENRRESMRKFFSKGKHRNWQRENKDKIKLYNLKRKYKKHNISEKEWSDCKKYFNNECAYCGMSDEFHKEKYNQQLHKEHVDHDGANDLSNCVPACKVCNSSKGDQILEQWYRLDNVLCDLFSDQKLKKIKSWLNVDYKLFLDQNKQDINN